MAKKEDRELCDCGCDCCDEYENFNSVAEFNESMDSLESLAKVSRNQVDNITLMKAICILPNIGVEHG